jgi:hypothetical protein
MHSIGLNGDWIHVATVVIFDDATRDAGSDNSGAEIFTGQALTTSHATKIDE